MFIPGFEDFCRIRFGGILRILLRRYELMRNRKERQFQPR